ncbi:ATP-binding cassette subfamily B protein RaxB [Silvimonas terrae]|uniref:Cyclolysin secretion/processing ATP-binding protein CyaB n=1 Tax=Silvimonas terrae TaxID=300266 RepID=A0A840R9A2_9NEIS|nr:peptidase domain-containing ABC transporter [Silvimonas terrae]MBB5189477.1 ATP-binding cassette subfamily B protein RaxB [Silvimonas terrae]
MHANSGLNWSWSRHLPLIRQTESAECGVACLAMVAGWYGYKIDLPSLRRRFGVSQHGATLGRLIQCAGAMHLSGRPLKLELHELSQLATPCILHWNLNHFVVLERVRGKEVVVHDPARGVLRLSFSEINKHFTGIALELTPTHEFVKRNERKKIRLTELVGKTEGINVALIRIFCFAIVLEALALLTPFINQIVIDEVLVAHDESLLTLIIIGSLMLTGTQTLIGIAREWATISMAVNFNMQWTANVFHHLVRLPIDWFEKRHLGDISAKFSAVDSIQSSLTTSILQAGLDLLLALGTLAMMLLYSTKLSLIAIGAALIYGLIRWIWFDVFRKAAENTWVASTKESSHFLETLRGILSLWVNDALTRREIIWRNLNVERRNAQLQQSKLGMAYHVLNTAIGGLVGATVIWFGAQAVLDRAFSVGMLVAYMSFQGRFTASISSLTDKIFEYRMLDVYNERLADIVLNEKEGVDCGLSDSTEPYLRPDRQWVGTGNGSVELPPGTPVLEVQDVSFSYGPGERVILSETNLVLRSGEIVALVGRSGGGKTTLFKLILGLYQPTEGKVKVLGHDSDKLDFTQVREHVGTVLQEDELFTGSILDNITLFAYDIDYVRAEYCAQLAELHSDIESLPMGYQTLIGEMGGSLSGGQKQRLLLARALYKSPKLLLLDEATSHLDTANEGRISQTIRKLGIPVLFIAHRPETIASADRVLELVNGRLAERG